MNSTTSFGRLVGRTSAPATGHIAVFVDRSPEAANAAWRAPLVAHDRGQPLHVIALHPLHANLAEADALADSLASEVRSKLDLRVFPRATAGTREYEGVEATRNASILVLPFPVRRGPWPPGSAVLRLLRRTGRPVLLARTAAKTSYRRVLAAVELDPDAQALIAAAGALSRPPCVKVLHALDTSHEETMRLADVPERAIRAQRERDDAGARRVLVDLIASVGASRHAEPAVTFGNAGPAVADQLVASCVDLVVIGKRPRVALIDVLRGGVAQCVLRSAGPDVLILPMPPLAPAAS